jgi:hypothetical protein
MLSKTLVTNEVKNASGTEVEFSQIDSNGRTIEYAAVGETPSAPHRLSVKHVEVGAGIDKRRRSLIRFDKTIAGQVDTDKPVIVSAYAVVDLPVGNMTAYTEANNVLAELMSFCASLGASTTILYDCTGSGASTLIAGTLSA